MNRIREQTKILLFKAKRGSKSVLKRLYGRFLRPFIRHRLPEKVRRTLLTDLTISQPDNSPSHRSTAGISPFSETPRLLLAYLKTGFASQSEHLEAKRLLTEDHDRNWSRIEPLTGSAMRETLNYELSADGALERQGFDLDYGARVAFNEEFKAKVTSISPRVAEIPFIQRHITYDADKILFAGRYPAILPLQVASSSNSSITVLHEGKFPYRHSRITPITGTLENVALEDNGFDLITYCFSGCEDLYGHERSLKNIFRLTKNGGRVLLTCPFAFGDSVLTRQR